MFSACSLFSTTQDVDQTLKQFIDSSEVITASFKHRIALFKSNNKTTTLKIYIEGDGRPWIGGKHISKDPSSNALMMFDLLQQTEGDRLYLGRPCYFKTNDEHCHFNYWTSHRYSKEVVESMAQVIQQTMQLSNYKHAVIIGHSGGGVIATLLACILDFTPDIITLAANLDIDRWAEIHKWSPLTGSLNPSNLSSECKIENAFHFYGGKDKNVTLESVQSFFSTGNANFVLLPDATHNNWPLFWEKIKQITSPLLGN